MRDNPKHIRMFRRLESGIGADSSSTNIVGYPIA